MIKFLKRWTYGHIIKKYNRIRRFVRNGFKGPDVSNYGWGIPYDPVEDWYKIFQGALNTYKNDIKYYKRRKLEMIKEMHKKGLSLEFISDITKFSVPKVRRIVKK